MTQKLTVRFSHRICSQGIRHGVDGSDKEGFILFHLVVVGEEGGWSNTSRSSCLWSKRLFRRSLPSSYISTSACVWGITRGITTGTSSLSTAVIVKNPSLVKLISPVWRFSKNKQVSLLSRCSPFCYLLPRWHRLPWMKYMFLIQWIGWSPHHLYGWIEWSLKNQYYIREQG
jgi:hypothetical protein